MEYATWALSPGLSMSTLSTEFAFIVIRLKLPDGSKVPEYMNSRAGEPAPTAIVPDSLMAPAEPPNPTKKSYEMKALALSESSITVGVISTLME